jgi:hypothetical protein
MNTSIELEEMMLSLNKIWIKHIKYINEDDLIACTDALLTELRSLPQIPSEIGHWLEQTVEDFHSKSWEAYQEKLTNSDKE